MNWKRMREWVGILVGREEELRKSKNSSKKRLRDTLG